MTPLRVQMIYQMQLARLAPKTQPPLSRLWRVSRRFIIAPPTNWAPGVHGKIFRLFCWVGLAITLTASLYTPHFFGAWSRDVD
jgi:hypothetical protein